MIRNDNNYVQFHDYSGHTMDSNFVLDGTTVYKVQVSGQYWYVKNMTTGDRYAGDSGSSSRSMSTKMTSFYAGYFSENGLDRLYGLAGIARATTEEEDGAIAGCLSTQEI